MELLFEYGDQHINRDGDPDLSLDSVLRSAIEIFDAQVLLDPFEEKFYLPSAAIQLCDSECWQREIVGQKDESFLGFGVVIFDPTQLVGIIFECIKPRQHNCLIVSETGGAIDIMRINSAAFEIGLCSGHKEPRCLRDSVKPCIIQIATIHYIESAWLYEKDVEDVHIVHFSI